MQPIRDLLADALNIQQSIRLEQEATARRKQERLAEAARQQAEAERLISDFQSYVQNISSCQTGLDFIFRQSPNVPGKSDSILSWFPQIPNTLDQASKCFRELPQKLKGCGISIDHSCRNKAKESLTAIQSLRPRYAIIHLCLQLDKRVVGQIAEIEEAISSVDNFISSLPQHAKINPKKLDAHLREAIKMLESASAECNAFVENSRKWESTPFSDYFKNQAKSILDKCQPVLSQYWACPKTTVSGKAIASIIFGVLSICCLLLPLIIALSDLLIIAFTQQKSLITPVSVYIVISVPFGLLAVLATIYGHLALNDIKAINLSGIKLVKITLRLVYGGTILFFITMIVVRIIYIHFIRTMP